MIKRPQAVPSTDNASETTQPAGAVILRKREAASDEATVREKLCAQCSRSFRVEPEQKFYLCPDCYRRNFVQKREKGRSETRILTHITCSSCGTQEYLPFVPDDREKALCRACFKAQKPEQKRSSEHPR
jgi:CxxC-x17-CxxC domain-containing protein